MSITEVTKQFNANISCETQVSLFTDTRRDVRQVTTVQHTFHIREVADRLYCQNPNKAITMDKQDIKLVFSKCERCPLCSLKDKTAIMS